MADTKHGLSDRDVEAIAEATGGEVLDAPKLSDAAVAPWEGLLADVPDAEGGSYEQILARIGEAESVADLDAPWSAGDFEQFEGKQLVVRGIRKMPSDYAGGLQYFIIADCVEKASGEARAVTTGAIGIVAQLVKAHALGAFPWTVVPIGSKRANQYGRRVFHLENVR